MDMNIYKKTRYQNIYKHKNGNYVVIINKPVKSSISRVDGEKIWKIEEALKIRDNPKTGLQKKTEIIYKDNFDELFDKYLKWCETIDKQAYNNIKKKKIRYNKHLKNKFSKSITKLTKEDISLAIDKLNTTDKQKNHVLKDLKAFLNWCVKEEILLFNPASPIKNYKVPKVEMHYWEPKDIQKFLEYIEKQDSEQSYIIKLFVLFGLSFGLRVGEIRALTYDCIDLEHKTIRINHSINYDITSEDFLSSTKTYGSQRIIDISEELIKQIDLYKQKLKDLGYNIHRTDLIFFNYKTNKPYSDSYIRNLFKDFCNDANVPPIRLYDLRHTFTTTMISSDIPLAVISKILGHTSFRTTVDKYGHLSEKTRKEIAKITDKYIV
jgi:integrase